MKEILGYLRWLFTELALWQWVFIVSICLQIISIAVAQPLGHYLYMTGLFIILGAVFKDVVRCSWIRYCEHRNSLFKTIQDSDR